MSFPKSRPRPYATTGAVPHACEIKFLNLTNFYGDMSLATDALLDGYQPPHAANVDAVGIRLRLVFLGECAKVDQKRLIGLFALLA